MSKENKNPEISEGISNKFVGRYFFGIRFLWRIQEIKYLLTMMMLLMVSMIGYYFLLIVTDPIIGESRIHRVIFVYGGYILLGFFLYIMGEITYFYFVSKNNELLFEKNKLLKMKFSPQEFKTSKNHRLKYLIITSIITIVILIVEFALLLANNIEFIVIVYVTIEMSLYIFSFGIFGILAFISTKNTMKTFEEKYSEKFNKHGYWTFIIFILPWLYILISLIIYDFILSIDTSLAQSIAWTVYLYLVMGIIGIPALFKKDWRIRHSTSLIASMLTTLTIVFIPFIIDFIIGLSGIVISFIVLILMFVQGTLNEKGKDVYEYYKAWEKNQKKNNLKSENNINSQKNEEVFSSTLINSDVSDPSSSLALVLWILTFCLYIFIDFSCSSLFLVSEESGILMMEISIFVIGVVQHYAILLTIVIFTFILLFHKIHRDNKLKEEPSERGSSIVCQNCNQTVKLDKTCINCGAKLLIQCPHCKQTVQYANFCEKCGKHLSNKY